MATELVKRQHYVPRTYLKYFSESKGKDYVIHALASEETEKNKIFPANTKDVAVERDLYTLPGETAEQKMAVEKFYSEEFEAHYDSIYFILTNEHINEISVAQRELIISTVITMYYRTTKWVNLNKDFMLRVFAQAFHLCDKTGKDYFMFENEKFSIAGKSLEEFTKEFNSNQQPGMILTQLEVAFKLIALRIKNDSICVVKINNDNLELITSDNPVTAANNNPERFAPFDPSNVLELPLDPKHRLLLIPECPPEQLNRIFRRNSYSPFDEIEKLTSNYSQMKNSERFIFGSKKALESYLITKQESERPIENGENMADIFKKLKELGL